MTGNGKQIQEQMQKLREELGDDADELARARRDLKDWRKYVQAYPWVCVAGAAALGLLLAPRSGGGRSRAPRKEEAEADTAAAAAGGTIVGLITAAAGRALMTYATQTAMRTFQQRFHPQSQDPQGGRER